MLRITSGCKATETLPVTPEAITLGLAADTEEKGWNTHGARGGHNSGSLGSILGYHNSSAIPFEWTLHKLWMFEVID